jgi:hypothetical protein
MGMGFFSSPVDCGHFDLIKSEAKWFIPQGYCLVGQGYELEAHWGLIPRVQEPKNYEFRMVNGVWELVWKKWEGSLSYMDEAYRQECDETSILGRLVDSTLSSEHTLIKSNNLIAQTCSVDTSVAHVVAPEIKYLAHCVTCLKCKSKNHHDWVLDSGASEHYTNNRQDLVDYESVKKTMVQMASALVPILGKGTVFISTTLCGKGHSQNLPCVLLSPGQDKTHITGKFLNKWS